MKNIWIEYERKKKEIAFKARSSEEYEKMIKELSDELGV